MQMPSRWSGSVPVAVEREEAQQLFKLLINPTVRFPNAINWQRILSMSPTLGGIPGVIKDLGDAVINILKQNTDRLLNNGWDIIVFPLIRMAIFVQELALSEDDENSGYTWGYRANEFGILVTGFLEMLALVQYTKRVVIRSTDCFRDQATGVERDMWSTLSILMGLELDSTTRRTAVWVDANVSEIQRV